MHEGELLPATLGEVERVAHDPLHAESRVHRRLVGDLVRRALADGSAVADIRAFRALADDDEVDLAGLGERAGHARVQLRGPQVDVVVELEPQLQQQSALDVRVLQARVAGHSADRAEQDRVVPLDRVEIGIRQRVAGLEEACGSEREMGLVEADAAARGRGIQHLLRLGDDFRTDAVTGDDGKLHGPGLMRTRHAFQRTGAREGDSSRCQCARAPRSVTAAITAATATSAAPMSAVTVTPPSNARAAASRIAAPELSPDRVGGVHRSRERLAGGVGGLGRNPGRQLQIQRDRAP